MADWYVNVNAPMISGELYKAIIDTKDGTKVIVDEVKYPDDNNCNILCTEDLTNGRSRLQVDLSDYRYDASAAYRIIKVSVLLDGEHKGSDSPDVQED